MTHPWSRLRLLLADSFVSIVVVLLVLALLGGWFTYTTHVASGTHVENRTIAEWETTGGFDHSATVTNDSGAFTNGTTLSNQSTYFSSVSPVLDGTFAYTYDASNGSLAANTTLRFVLHSVEESGGNTTEYWRITRHLGDNRTDSLAPGDPLTVSFSRNMSATQQLADRIEERIGGSPGTVEGVVVARVRADGEVEGEKVSRTRRYTLPIEIEDGEFHVADSKPITNTTALTRRVSVANTTGPLRSTGSILLFVLPLGLLVGLVGARSQGSLDLGEEERGQIETGRAREEFEEWITTGRLPDTVLDNPRVEVDSLEGLVDTAIDTNRRVIEDPEWQGYVVLVDGICYTHVPSNPSEDFEFGTR